MIRDGHTDLVWTMHIVIDVMDGGEAAAPSAVCQVCDCGRADRPRSDHRPAPCPPRANAALAMVLARLKPHWHPESVTL